MLPPSLGMDHCYDCRAEVDILRSYLMKCHAVADDADLVFKIEELSAW